MQVSIDKFFSIFNNLYFRCFKKRCIFASNLKLKDMNSSDDFILSYVKSLLGYYKGDYNKSITIARFKSRTNPLYCKAVKILCALRGF